MPYTINLTDGAVFATVADGTINTSSSMTLVGKNYAGYGQFLDTNFMRLLENASNTTPPGAPVTGQLWWDSGIGVLKVYSGTVFKSISAATASATAPSGATSVAGDLWFDSINAQLNVYTGAAWILVGPQSSSAQGTSGAIVATITDNATVNHVVIQLYVNNSVVGMISKDATFTPGAAVPGGWGIQTISPGITLSAPINSVSQLFTGTATNAQTLNGISSTQFVRNDINGSLTGNLVVTGSVGVGSLINNNANGVGNIGSSSGYFDVVFATASRAQYADVAERFAADDMYDAGTVVELGGSAEITRSCTELSDIVFGVISTRAAYLMNDGAGSDDTHPPVAMTGRVPVKVIGQVLKGDRLVSAGNGHARSAKAGEATAFNVIGRALRDKLNTETGTVEAIVTIK
jgi:hypothetical protein